MGFLGFVTEIGSSFEKYLGTKNDDFRFEKPGNVFINKLDEWVRFEDQYYMEAKK